MEYTKTDKNQLRIVETIPEKQVEKIVELDYLVNREVVLLKEIEERQAELQKILELKGESDKLEAVAVDKQVETESVDVVK